MTSPESEVALLREALEPFAAMGRMLEGPFAAALFKDEQPIGVGAAWNDNGTSRTITYGDLRVARDVLARTNSSAGDGVPEGMVVPAEVLAFLQGIGPLQGRYFGDDPPDGERGRFWWRKHLRDLSATDTQKEMG